MPILEVNRAIKEYYQQVKELYPDITEEHFHDICKAPGIFFKQCIKGTRLPHLMIKHIGKFRVFRNKVRERLRIERLTFEQGKMPKEEYDRNYNFFMWYLGELQDYDINRRSKTNFSRTQEDD